ncbi:DUF4267 domain-containing protein [Amycolatopsis benzoatilytica]|uniref:DUF4267 domain-containing protein n=1 Tax=Amycolatopsis benzoatilytica TaxID=346045 RepID=UPI000363D192|nr:DUF4267 domain-containing protein [Amycolatopsis benzoatilytica]
MLVTAYVLTALLALGIFYIGLLYLFAPEKNAAGFGFTTVPAGPNPLYTIKGVRDLGLGLVLVVALLAGGPHIAGWVLLAEVFMPLGDLTAILLHKGKKAIAFGVHGATAVVMAVVSVLLLLV